MFLEQMVFRLVEGLHLRRRQCRRFAMTNEQLTMNNEQLASFGRSKGFLDCARNDTQVVEVLEFLFGKMTIDFNN